MNTLHSSTKTANSRGAIQPSQLVKTYINAEACSSVIAPNTLLIPKPNLPLSHILNFDFLELDYFKKEVNWIEQLENILKDSKKYLSLVYAYRGCISAIPSYSTITPTSAVEEESKADFYRLVEEIMQPEMQKIKDVMVFFDTSMATVFIILNEVCLGLSQNAPTEYFFYTIAKVLDMFLVLDSLKNMKVSLNNDFTLIFRRSRSLSKNQSGDDFENQKLYLFLANKDVFYTKLKTLIPTYTGIEDFFWELVNVLLDRFERGYYMSSADQFSLLKSIAFALLLLDPFLTPKNMAQKKWKMDRFNKVFRGNLVVHLYGDLILEIPGILSKTTVYKWEFPAIPTYVPDIVALRNEYSCLLAQITLDIQEVEKFEGKEMSEEFSKSMYERLLKGLKLISTLTGAALQMNTYKYAKPTNHNINPNCPPNALNYEQAIRYNYTQADKLLLLELLSMVKIGAEKLIRAEVILLPVARRYLYSIFSTYQTSLLPELLRNVNKKRKSNYPYLTTLMSMANAVMNPPESYVAQGLIGRIYKLNALSGGFMKDKDLKDSQWIELDIYHELLYWSPIILDFTNHIRLTSDLGALWCKEFYLELSKQIQFPIETSLPWMLIQQALSPTSTLDLTQTLFIPFLIYDDAANSALTELKLQFIYNEIEAEANLAFDLFLSQYSNMVFQHFKCKAASSLLPESYRKLYGKEKAEEFIYRRHEDVLSKFKTIHILGRCIHFNDIMAHFLNLAIRNSFEAILSRFESTSLHGVIELHCLLQILQVTHEELSKYVPLDAYETIFMEIDERNVGHGRILAHIVSELLVVASSHTYNATSDKFLLSPVVVFPIDHLVRGAGKHPKHEYLFGNKYFAQMFQGKLAPFQSSIGMDHFKAIVELLGPRVTVVVNELTDHFKYSLRETLVPYIWALASQFPPSVPKVTTKTNAAEIYATYLNLYDSLLSLNDLVNVFHGFRLLGSIFSYIYYLELAMSTLHTLHVHDRLHVAEVFQSSLTYLNFSVASKLLQNDASMTNTPLAFTQTFVRSLQPYFQSLIPHMTPEVSPSHARSKGFYKVFSFLLFAYCSDRLSMHDIGCPALFGDGVVVLGTLLLCWLHQAEAFQALDPTFHLCQCAKLLEQKGGLEKNSSSSVSPLAGVPANVMFHSQSVKALFLVWYETIQQWLGKEKYWDRPWKAEGEVHVPDNTT